MLVTLYQHFLLFPKCFLSNQRNVSTFHPHRICRLQILSFGKGYDFIVRKRTTRETSEKEYKQTRLEQLCMYNNFANIFYILIKSENATVTFAFGQNGPNAFFISISFLLTHSNTMTPFDAPGQQTF